MKTILSREDLLNLVKFTTPIDNAECLKLERQGRLRFTGNQSGESWAWEKTYLDSLDEIQLWQMYQKYKTSK